MRWARRFTGILAGIGLAFLVAACEIDEPSQPTSTDSVEVRVPASFVGYRGEIRHYAGLHGQEGELIAHFQGYFPVGKSIHLGESEPPGPRHAAHWELVEIVLESHGEEPPGNLTAPTLQSRRAEARSTPHQNAWFPTEWTTMVADIWSHLRLELHETTPELVAEHFTEDRAQRLFEAPDYQTKLHELTPQIADKILEGHHDEDH